MGKISLQCVALLMKYEEKLWNCGNILFKQFCEKTPHLVSSYDSVWLLYISKNKPNSYKAFTNY